MKLYYAPLEGITTYIYRNTHAQVFGGVDAYFAGIGCFGTRYSNLRDVCSNCNSTDKKSRATAFCVLLAIALSCAFKYVPLLSKVPSGFVIIICAILASALFAVLSPVRVSEEGDNE